MAFTVIPAIDVAGGRLARFTRYGPAPVSAFRGDPVAAARVFADAGASWIHVVDMDLAFTGVAGDIDVVRSVAALGVRVQAGGGIVDDGEVSAALAAGATRVVVSSAALADLGRTTALIASQGDALAIGIEVEEGRIRARGRRPTDLPLAETVRSVVAAGAAMLVVTAVARVGSLRGPDLETLGSVVAAGIPVVAAGGVASAADLAAVREAGAVGAIVGRAALEEGLDLAEIIDSFAAP